MEGSAPTLDAPSHSLFSWTSGQPWPDPTPTLRALALPRVHPAGPLEGTDLPVPNSEASLLPPGQGLSPLIRKLTGVYVPVLPVQEGEYFGWRKRSGCANDIYANKGLLFPLTGFLERRARLTPYCVPGASPLQSGLPHAVCSIPKGPMFGLISSQGGLGDSP